MTNLAAATGVNDGRGSRITLLDRESGDQPGPSTGIPQSADDTTTRERVTSQLLKRMLIAPIALEEPEREHGVPSDTPSEQLCQTTPGPHPEAIRSEGDDGGEHEYQGAVTEVASERIHEDDQLGEDVRHDVRSGGSGGECRCPGHNLSINIYQFRRELRRTRRSRLSPFPLMS